MTLHKTLVLLKNIFVFLVFFFSLQEDITQSGIESYFYFCWTTSERSTLTSLLSLIELKAIVLVSISKRILAAKVTVLEILLHVSIKPGAYGNRPI